jgi:hypothetical protein
MQESIVGLEMQIVRLAKRETPNSQFYSPIFINNKYVALTKFVHEKAEPIERDHPIFIVLRKEADDDHVPFFLIRYDDAMEWFYVTSGNSNACCFSNSNWQ